MAHMFDVWSRHKWYYDDITPGVGPFFLGESQSRIYPNVCQIWLRSDGRVEKKGEVQRDRKGTLQLYMVDNE